MMQKKYAVLVAVLLLSQMAIAQLKYLNVTVSVNGGYSELLHKTDFRGKEPVYDLYNVIAKSHGGQDEFTWEDFLETYDINDRFGQPRLGFSAQMTYRDWPIKLLGEAMTSSSSYTRASYSATMGLGKDFYFSDSSWYCSFLTGYKLVIRDFGFGANTFINSVGDDQTREDLSSFFAPVETLGRTSGDMFAFRVGIAKTLEWYYRRSDGVEGFYELDLTDKIVRSSRMTNYGAQVYVRCKILGKNPEPNRYYPNPGGGRRN